MKDDNGVVLAPLIPRLRAVRTGDKFQNIVLYDLILSLCLTLQKVKVRAKSKEGLPICYRIGSPKQVKGFDFVAHIGWRVSWGGVQFTIRAGSDLIEEGLSKATHQGLCRGPVVDDSRSSIS